jgi:hypothetical protein
MGTRTHTNVIYREGQAPETVTTEIETSPILLSKTGFQDLCWARLGGGTAGMARFSEILEGCRDSESGALRAVYRRYDAADTFNKTNVTTMLTVIGALLNPGEAAAILNNWPEA